MLLIVITIIFTICLIIISSFLVTWCSHSECRPPLPPGPKPLPFIGNLISMLWNKPTFRWIHRMMEQMGTKILCIRLGNVHVIVVSDPKIACEFVKEQDMVFSSMPDCMSGYLTSSGYLSTTLAPMGDHWKMMRRILAHDILSVARHRWLKTNEMKKLVIFLVTKGIVNVRIIVQQHASNIIRKIVFGSRHFIQGRVDGGHGDEDIEFVDSLFKLTSHVYAFCVTDYFSWLRWITDFDGHERNIRNGLHTARKLLNPLIDDRIQQWKDGVRRKEDDLLDVFINLKSPQLTADQIKAQILDIFLATFDSTPNSSEWIISEMINQPRIFNKAVHELDVVVGKHRIVQESDIIHLNYIKSCVKEALRLHPVAAFNLPHVASADTTVAGYFIPKGSHVILSRLWLGRNPEVWDDPLTFIPERHMNDGNEVVLNDHDLRMLSFSTGRRGCPGVLLGTTMTVMVLALLIQGLNWELPPNEPHVDLKESMQSLLKAKPLFALAKPRLPHYLYPAATY